MRFVGSDGKNAGEAVSGLVTSRGLSLEDVGGTGWGISWGLSGKSDGF